MRILNFPLWSILFFLLSGCSDSMKNPRSESSTVADNRRPNVILVSDDTLRADFLSAYREDALKTKALDALAEDGVLFERAYSSAPWTLPAMTSILTGWSVDVHRVVKQNSRLPDGAMTLAERLKEAGYQTAAFGQNRFLSRDHNLHQGFDAFDFYPKLQGESSNLKAKDDKELRTHITSPQLTTLAMDWIKRRESDPFFLWLHYFDPHPPYTPHPSYRPSESPPPNIQWRFPRKNEKRSTVGVLTAAEQAWVQRLYAAEVQQVDTSLGRLLEFLEREGLYEESLVIFTSDHGEEFWEHGGYEHGHSLYNEVISVPLILKPPGRGSPGRRVPTSVSTVGIFGTVLELCGLDFEAEDFSFPSLASFWQEPGPRVPIAVGSGGVLYGSDQRSMILGSSKIILDLKTGETEIFDLAADYGELRPLVKVDSEQENILEQALERNLRTARRLRARHNMPPAQFFSLDESSIAHLKALGYL